jgi:hypothetical protein
VIFLVLALVLRVLLVVVVVVVVVVFVSCLLLADLAVVKQTFTQPRFFFSLP